MKQSGDSNGSLSDAHRRHQHRRRRRCLCCLLCLLILVLLAVAAVVLALTVFKARDPKTEIISTTVSGVSPRVDLPALRIEINVTLKLVVRVRNPNYAAFSHSADGRTRLLYRGTQVGEAMVEPGHIPARGSEIFRLDLAVEVDNIAAQLDDLLADIAAGAVALDTETRLPGRVTILGFIKRHAVATSDCHVVIGLSGLKVRSQECTNKTEL